MKSLHSKSTLHILILVSLLISLISGAVFVTPAQAVTRIVSDCASPSGAAGRLVDQITSALSGDTINFSCSGTISLAETITISKNLTIDGTGQTVTISGNNAVRVMQVNIGTSLTLNNMTIANGNVTSDNGGGIYSSGTLTITNSTFSHNSATSILSSGGGIYIDAGTLTITNSTFSSNSAASFISGGGGIYNNAGTATITNNTFSGNSATSGGGIYNAGGTVTLRNTIVANNSGGSCGGTITNGGNNLGDDATCGWGSASGSRSFTNPNLGPLANYGGPTQTFALFTGSPAIDGVTFNGSNSAPSTDQRGVVRPHGDGYDIGAFETEAQAGPILFVNTSADTDDGSCDLLGQGISNKDCTLREAIYAANTFAGGNLITFSISGTITLDSTLPTIISAGGALTINGAGQTLTISGNNAVRVLLVDISALLTLYNLTIANGKCAGCNGGGILNHGTLNITNSSISGNSADNGGGISNSGASTITNSTFSVNSAYLWGGGVFNIDGNLTITNSTFSGNAATPGSDIYNNGGIVTIRNTIVANNTDDNCWGTIANGGNNIDSGTTCGWTSVSGSMSNTNPLLGTLTGAPAYFPLNTGSKAINGGNDAICAAAPVSNTSQNGVTRPQGAHCDIGAFELRLFNIFLPIILR